MQVPPRVAVAAFLDKRLAARFEAKDLAVLLEHAERREAGLLAARRGATREAQEELAAARHALEAPCLSATAAAVGMSFLEPAEAYLAYRLGRHDDARALLRQADARVSVLARERGYAFLGVHRLQIAQNLVRIHVRLDECKEGATLASEVADRIERCDGSLAFVPEEVRTIFFDAIVGEIAVVLAGRGVDQNPECFAPFACHARCRPKLQGDAGHAWCRMKLAESRADTKTAIEHAITLVRSGRTPHPSLWFAAVVDGARFCTDLDSELAAMADRLVGDAAKLPDAPPGIRALGGTRSSGLDLHLASLPSGA